MADPTITAVPGVAVGHHTDEEAATGVTVLTFPEPNQTLLLSTYAGAHPALARRMPSEPQSSR